MSNDSSGGQWSENPNDWTQEQRDQYFGVIDHSQVANALVAEADVPHIDFGSGEAIA
jgi:hypothetical protein